MTINHRFVLYIFLLFIVSCSRLYHGSWNQPYFDENVQPDKLGKNVSSWEDGARIPEDEFSVEWWYIDAKLEDSSIVVAYFYKVHNITNQYFIGFNYTSPDGVDTFKLKRYKKMMSHFLLIAAMYNLVKIISGAILINILFI